MYRNYKLITTSKSNVNIQKVVEDLNEQIKIAEHDGFVVVGAITTIGLDLIVPMAKLSDNYDDPTQYNAV